ncbi:2-hydroxyacid dehydrogenase [Lacrimispora sp.]|uniref:2-hydroxyacid dehydrogenase n=1 Tax=Lacrimispora sp. TaxID=2719234 RepID=UPI0028B241F7|nr:NAD(P)-dependent oxidoreductase [Lacrimispora sp.]
MKVVICQGEAIGGRPSREELIQYWKEQLKTIPEIDEVVFHDGFHVQKRDEIAGDADALLGVWIQEWCDDAFFLKHPRLRYLASFAHGYGEFDRDIAAKHHVTMTNTIYGDVTIAQFAMALLLDICHNIRLQDEYYKKCMDLHQVIGSGGGPRVQSRQIELFGKTIGIIGLGNIGLWTARMAAGFGMKPIAFSNHKKTGEKYDFIEQVELEELLLRSDVISIHCPLTKESYHMINQKTIAMMKDGVILINTARGGIIDEADLKAALDSGKIYAAGLDVVDQEPLRERCALMDCSNAVITPHIAWAPEEARYRTIRVAAENLKNWINGMPTSVIA